MEIHKTRKLWLLLCAVLATAVTASPSTASTWHEDIPFHLTGGFAIVVRGGIGPLNDLSLLLDTGAVPSVVSQKLASRIGVTGTFGSLALVNKEIQAQYATVEDVRFGALHAASLPVVLVDLDPLESILSTKIDAIIGLDIFAGQDFSIDYKHKKILPNLGSRTLQESPVGIYIFESSPYCVLDIKVGARTFRMLLDTGANNVALFSSNLPKSILQVSLKSGATGTTQLFPPQSVSIAGTRFGDQTIDVLENSPLALKNIDGVIGPTVLGMTRLEIDWAHKRIRWDRE